MLTMCFSIPLKVLRVEGRSAVVEGEKKILLPPDLELKTGEYLRVSGNIAESKLSVKEGLKIRKLIRKLNI